MTEYGPGGEERRINGVKLEHRLTVVEQGIKHYNEAQETVVKGIAGLHKRFTDVKTTVCKKVDDTADQAEANKKSIKWIEGRPRRIFTLCLEVLGGVGVLSAIAFAIFRIIQ